MGLDQKLVRYTGELDDDKADDDRSNTEEIAYFRKANFLHGWIEDHCNNGKETNCDYVDVNLEQLMGLRNSCQAVLDDVGGDPEPLATQLLPTRAGFFFGSVEYDETYLRDVEDVRNALDTILKEEERRHHAGEAPGKYAYWSWW